MKTLLLDLYFQSLSTLADGSIKLSLTTQELQPEEVAQLFSLRRQTIKGALKKDNAFTEEELREIIETPVEKINGKTPSQRLRAVLYRIWEQNPSEDFETYYGAKMEKVIDHYKTLLD